MTEEMVVAVALAGSLLWGVALLRWKRSRDRRLAIVVAVRGAHEGVALTTPFPQCRCGAQFREPTEHGPHVHRAVMDALAVAS